MSFASETFVCKTSDRGDYTVIVDGPGRFFFRFGGDIQLFRRFVTPAHESFLPAWHHRNRFVPGCAGPQAFLSLT